MSPKNFRHWSSILDNARKALVYIKNISMRKWACGDSDCQKTLHNCSLGLRSAFVLVSTRASHALFGFRSSDSARSANAFRKRVPPAPQPPSQQQNHKRDSPHLHFSQNTRNSFAYEYPVCKFTSFGAWKYRIKIINAQKKLSMFLRKKLHGKKCVDRCTKNK